MKENKINEGGFLEKMKNNKGITLIALVVTIVVLLILAGVSIGMLTGENGIITQAQEAKLETRGGEVEEQVNLWKNENKLNEYSSIKVKTESELINELKTKGLVFEEEIDENSKTITIGTRVISYEIKEQINDPTALKFLVNSGDDGIVVLPISVFGCDVSDGYEIDWGDGTTGKDETVIASNKKIASTKKIYIGQSMPLGISHTYQEKNKEYVITITGVCEQIWTDFENTTKEKIIEILQWGETGLRYINLSLCTNLRKIANPNENSFANITSFYAAFTGCTNLTEIPEDLFANCPNVTDFSYALAGCNSLIGRAPELWTRGTNSEENNYQGEPYGEDCFNGCTGLTNYDEIPDYWK